MMKREIQGYILKVRQIYKAGGEHWSAMKTMINVMHHEALAAMAQKSAKTDARGTKL
jgi:hypothetical protein